MKARVQRAIVTKGEPLAKLGETDEDDRQQRATVPGVIEQDVQVIERVLVEQVRLVDQEHRMDALLGALLDVAGDGIEQGAGGGSRREAERDAELAIEVAPAERGIVVVGEPEARGWNAMAER